MIEYIGNIICQKILQIKCKLKLYDEYFFDIIQMTRENIILYRNKKPFHLWTGNFKILQMMEKFKSDFLDKDFARKVYLAAWNYIEEEGSKEKFISFYED